MVCSAPIVTKAKDGFSPAKSKRWPSVSFRHNTYSRRSTALNPHFVCVRTNGRLRSGSTFRESGTAWLPEANGDAGSGHGQAFSTHIIGCLRTFLFAGRRLEDRQRGVSGKSVSVRVDL